jgi:hypothetical protein
VARFDEWNREEDALPGGGVSIPFRGYSETMWIVRLQWPTRSLARLVIREHEDGRITAQPGRVWIPGCESEEEDGA